MRIFHFETICTSEYLYTTIWTRCIITSFTEFTRILCAFIDIWKVEFHFSMEKFIQIHLLTNTFAYGCYIKTYWTLNFSPRTHFCGTHLTQYVDIYRIAKKTIKSTCMFQEYSCRYTQAYEIEQNGRFVIDNSWELLTDIRQYLVHIHRHRHMFVSLDQLDIPYHSFSLEYIWKINSNLLHSPHIVIT